ncbi:MAG: adenosylcobinamide-GDP ribazoletransferase, partial [Acidobacteriota bacterium]
MNWLRGELYTFLLAVQFLTRVPLPNWPIYTPERFGASVRHYPTVGLFIGAFSAGVLATASVLLPPLVAVLLSFAATIALTGAFHEDGLADMFDGVGGGNDRNAILEIMKDSRIGVYGACGLVSVLAIKAATLWELTRPLGITGVCLL